MTNLVSCSSPRCVPHLARTMRIAAGIEASMITSLGTCRLVMPRSESTMASARPVVVGGGDRLLDRLPLLRGQLLQRGEDAGQAVVRVGADRGQVLRRTGSKTSAK